MFYIFQCANALRASQLFLQAKTSTTTSTTQPTLDVANDNNDEIDEVEVSLLLILV